MEIGIFDSGIGGMTLLHQAMVSLPHEKYIFYADIDHVPYGTKSREQVISYVDAVMQFMIAQNCKAVVIACNTATAVAAQIMRQKYDIPIIGIEPAVKPAVRESCGKRVMVVATPLTVREEKLKNLVERVDSLHQVDLLALPRLVEFAEREEFVSDAVTEYLREALSSYETTQYSELVLGCTHFNFFKDTFQHLLPEKIHIIDGSVGTIRQLARVLESRGELEMPISMFDEFIEREPQAWTKVCVRYFESGRELTEITQMEHIRRLHDRLEIMRLLSK